LTRAIQTALLLYPAGTRIEVSHTNVSLHSVWVTCGAWPVQACELITEKVNPAQADMGRPPIVLKTEFPTVYHLEDLPEEWWPDPGTVGEPNEVQYFLLWGLCTGNLKEMC
jgi:hypothetical protein